MLILFQISSCSHVNHQNFHKQKFLKGKLKSVYDSDSEQDISSVKEDSLHILQEPVFVSQAEKELIVYHTSDALTQEKNLLSEEETIETLTETEKSKVEFPLINKIKKSPILKSIQPKKKNNSYEGEANLFWFVILASLGLIALPFAFLIGFWAFVLSFLLLTAAGIVLLTGDYDNPFLIIVIITFFILLCIAAAFALIWFIIWGIIQLVN